MFNGCSSLKKEKEINKNNNTEINIIIGEVNILDLIEECQLINSEKIPNDTLIIYNGQNIKTPYKFQNKGKHSINYIFKNKASNISYMFSDCSSLTSLNLSNFNTNNVKDMSYMFSKCFSLTYLNLSNFNTIPILTYIKY